MAITAKLLAQRFPGLLGKLSRDELETLLEVLIPIETASNQELQHCGDRADSLHLIWEGSLALSMEFDGKEIPLGRLESGQHIGTVALIEPGQALTTVRVAELGTVLRLEHAGLVILRATHPLLGSRLIQALSLDLAERLRVYEEGMARRTRPPAAPEEFALLCRPLLGIKTG